MEQPIHTRILAIPPHPQDDCPLFNRFPAEIREHIFTLALADFPDPDAENRYESDTYYTRPAYFAPRKSDTRLLRTCRAVYNETWFLPFIIREQTHWLTSDERMPPEFRDLDQSSTLIWTLDEIATQHGRPVEIRSLRAFAQMWAIERGQFARLLAIPGLHPRTLTLTIRHQDWWWWEHDEPLRMESAWVPPVFNYLSDSVRELRIELETLERKKEQVEEIGKQMRERWYFRRADDVVLFPDLSDNGTVVDRWTGPSTFDGETWTRDESREGEIDYYILTVIFRPQKVVERIGQISPTAKDLAEKGIFNKDGLRIAPAEGDSDNDEGNDSNDYDEYEEEGEEEEEEEE